MTDMPGMRGPENKKPMAAPALPTAIALTAAQIKHGDVHWAPATTATASGTATLPGEVAPNEDRTARFGAPARGRVLTVHVRPGDRVDVGQPLVTLLSPEAGMAQSDVAKAEAERWLSQFARPA